MSLRRGPHHKVRKSAIVETELAVKCMAVLIVIANVTCARADTADDQISALTCKTHADLAFTLMTDSQNSITMDAMLRLLESRHYSADVKVIVRAMLTKVYAEPVYPTPELKAKAAIDFRDKTETDCRVAVLEGK